MIDPTERQVEVLFAIWKLTREQGRPPTLRALGAELGVGPTAVCMSHATGNIMTRLMRDGWVKPQDQPGRRGASHGPVLTDAGRDLVALRVDGAHIVESKRGLWRRIWWEGAA